MSKYRTMIRKEWPPEISGLAFFILLKESSPFREPLKLKMPAGSGHDETDGG